MHCGKIQISLQSDSKKSSGEDDDAQIDSGLDRFKGRKTDVKIGALNESKEGKVREVKGKERKIEGRERREGMGWEGGKNKGGSERRKVGRVLGCEGGNEGVKEGR